MSKPKYEAAYLTDYFRKLTAHVEQNTNSLVNAISNEEINCVLPSRNPFLNDMIIKHLFGFLPLEDIKEFRLVCWQWNSIAEIFLRKRSVIHFRQNALLPDTFIEVSKYSYPDLPFSSFAFSNSKRSRWVICDIKAFLEKWQKNIKEVTFDGVTLARKVKTDKRVLIRKYDVAQLFINPSNITSLTIKTSEDYDPITQWEISLEKFVSIKTLSLAKCRIIVPVENPSITRVAPLNINLDKISFIQNGKVSPHIEVNDVVDFSKALNINFQLELSDDLKYPILDMGKKEFNLNQLHLISASLKNWALAKGDVLFLNLIHTPFVERNDLKIKMLSFNFSKIDLGVLPKTLEVLQLERHVKTEEIICRGSLQLPNLKYLWVDIKHQDILSYFSNCSNLVELEIRNSNSLTDFIQFRLGSIPKNVKRIKMDLLPIKFTDDCILELDTLILECAVDGLCPQDCIAIIKKMKAKLLVVMFDEVDVITSDIVELVSATNQSQKFLIGSYSDLHKITPFEGSEWSKYVDKKSDFYEFENEVGKAITEQEFTRYDFESDIPEYFH